MPFGPISVPIAAGSHTLTFVYEKDTVCCKSGLDAAWIDDVVLPPLQLATLTVAGAGTGSGTVTGSGINFAMRRAGLRGPIG